MPIPLIMLIHAMYPAFRPETSKLHLATSDQNSDPLDVWDAGNFDIWQQQQSLRNFSRENVLALISAGVPDLWLFAGIWRRIGEPVWGPKRFAPRHPGMECFTYNLAAMPEVAALAGRVSVHFHRPGRQSYLNLERWSDQIILSQLTEAPRETPRFREYRTTRLAMPILRRIVQAGVEDWRTALSSVGGVYLITDRDGAQYVGSASGEGGFWARWSQYARNGHGGNVRLRERLGKKPVAASEAFHLSILETADSRVTRNEIIRRESFWKDMLGSRAVGLNLN